MKLITTFNLLILLSVRLAEIKHSKETKHTNRSEQSLNEKEKIKLVRNCIDTICSQNLLKLKNEVNCINKCFEKYYAKTISKTNLKMGMNNYCIKRHDPEKLSIKDYLILFAKGPCSPVALVPGVMASKLVIEIDCEKLRSSEEKVFE